MRLAVAFVLHTLEDADLLTLRRGLERELADLGKRGELLLRADTEGQLTTRPDALVALLARQRGIAIRLFETPATAQASSSENVRVRDAMLVDWADRVAIFRGAHATPDVERLTAITRDKNVTLSTWSVEAGVLIHASEGPRVRRVRRPRAKTARPALASPAGSGDHLPA